MTTRTVLAIQFDLQSMRDRCVIIWPNHITEKTCARLINSRRIWMTARRVPGLTFIDPCSGTVTKATGSKEFTIELVF